MKKIIYLILTLSYAVIGIVGDTGQAYMETGASDKLYRSVPVLIVLVTLVVAGLAIFFFAKIFTKGFSIQKTAGKVLIILIFLGLSLVLTLGVLKFANSHTGPRTVFQLDGHISNKWIKYGKKNTKTYFVTLTDDKTGASYDFRVKRKVYDGIGFIGSSVQKEFYRGSMGIIYRSSI